MVQNLTFLPPYSPSCVLPCVVPELFLWVYDFTQHRWLFQIGIESSSAQSTAQGKFIFFIYMFLEAKAQSQSTLSHEGALMFIARGIFYKNGLMFTIYYACSMANWTRVKTPLIHKIISIVIILVNKTFIYLNWLNMRLIMHRKQ